MPDIQEGLEIGGVPQRTYEEGDVNTPGGFEAALGRAVSGEVEQAEPSEAETPDEGQPAPDEGDDAEEAPEETAAQWRTRYEEAQRLIGRQGQELGELRSWAAQAEVAPQAPPQQLAGPLDLEALVEENGGQKVIDWAIDNNPDTIEDVARIWALSGDPEGSVFYADYRAEQARLEQAPQQPPQELDPALQDLALQRKLTDVWAEQRATDPQFSTYEEGIGAALTSRETPAEIIAMLFSGKPDDMLSAANFLKPYAQLEAIKAGSKPAEQEPEPAPQDTPAERARREQIRRTAIVTGSQRLQTAGEQPETGELDSAQRIARFKELFDEVPSTDIQQGLTINGQPVVQPRPRAS